MPETIFEALRESHEIQRSLMRRLKRSRPGDERDTLFRLLRIELAAHEAAEERYLYVHILMDDRGLHASRDALHDHHEIDEIVEDLEARGHGERGWMNTVKALSTQLYEHLREEEKIFFQIAGKILGEKQKATLATQYRKNYRAMHGKLESD